MNMTRVYKAEAEAEGLSCVPAIESYQEDTEKSHRTRLLVNER
jgi:hypothetical protein